MKSLKAAAVIAGSMVVAGIAAPAVALDVAAGKPDVTGVVNKVAKDPADLALLDQANVLDKKKSGLSGTVEGAKTTLTEQAEGHVLDGRTLQV
ncbi:hypothetical protein [Streptomyces sp.]|uniref:hypothetical protein n=1 Tax=Streptomyces sp. TaxID=1931 RepID=UPI002D3852AF|nr:hypothetical protein [Streptomyces sp.]HZF89983.1 hypothetical protein [Streptomyces sp.]